MIIHVIIVAFAAWRISHLLVNEVGPGRVFSRIRSALGVPDGPGELHPVPFFGPIVSCVLCASVWASGGLWLLGTLTNWTPIAVFAAMGVVLWLESNTED
jgi:hypothetical protein